MNYRRYSLSLTTDGTSAATGYIDLVEGGHIEAIIYTKTDFADGVTLAVTVNETGENILTIAGGGMNASKKWRPRAQVQDAADGTDLTYDGTRKQTEKIVVGNCRVKFVIGAGGVTKSGAFVLVMS